ncbi:hypothetical protein D039_4930A, partial [Vibrio parahaemolyticus EKP-028]
MLPALGKIILIAM